MKFHILAVTAACAQMTMAQVQDDGLAQRINNLKRGNTNRGLKGQRSQRELFDPENPDTRELMPLEIGCATEENICDWAGPHEAKYSVCYKKSDGTKETKCVDYASAALTLGSKTKSGKRTLDTCGCCDISKCPKGPFPEPICPDDPKCPTGSGKGKGGNDKKTFCFFDKSMNADSVQRCEDPYYTIKENEGDIFLACGTECSQAPSSAPTDSCLACDGNAKFFFSPALLNWNKHKILAEQIGCVMASINSPAEQLAAQEVADAGRETFFPGLLLPALSRLVWLGADRLASPLTPRTFSWTDGSGTFNADDTITSSDYANWQAAEIIDGNCGFFNPCDDIDQQPDGLLGDAVFMAFPDFDGAPDSSANWDDWTWGDASKSFLFPALYLCCDDPTNPTNSFAGCAVTSE